MRTFFVKSTFIENIVAFSRKNCPLFSNQQQITPHTFDAIHFREKFTVSPTFDEKTTV